MSCIYLNSNSWYIKSKGKPYHTGYTVDSVGATVRNLLNSKKRVADEILGLEDGHKLKNLFFDKPPETKILNGRISIEDAFKLYEETINGLDEKGNITDERAARNYCRVKKSQINIVKKKFNGWILKDIKDTDILKWIKEMQGKKYKSETIKKYVYILSAVFTFGKSKSRKWCEYNPVTDIDECVSKEFKNNPDVWDYEGREVDLTWDEAQAMLKASRGVTEFRRKSHRNRLWFYFLMALNFYCGPRLREMLTLQKKNVFLDKFCFVVTGKNAKKKYKRTVTYEYRLDLKALFAEFCLGLKDSDYLFSPNGGKDAYTNTAITKNFAKVRKFCKLPKEKTFRDCRHFCALFLEERGVKHSTIATQLGTSVKVLEKTYLKQSTEAISAELVAKAS